MSALLKWDDAGERPVHRPIRALLLDDCSFDRRRIRRYSKKSRLPVEFSEVPSLKEMSKAMEREQFDLFLLDYQLPEGNGLSAVDMIQRCETHKDAAVIMITGQEQQKLAISAMRQGCHDLIAKDEMSPTMLRERMSAALERVRGLSQPEAMNPVALHEPIQRAVRKAMQSEAMQQLIEDGLRRAMRQEHLPTGLSEAVQMDALLGSYLQEDEFSFKSLTMGF